MRKEATKYKISTFIRYVGDAFIYPFLALYLKSIGLENKDVGLIMMILPLVAIFINPIWSTLSKNINSNRIFIRVLTIIEAIAVVILVNVGANVWLIALVIFIIGVSGQPFYILFDSYTVTFSKLENYEYSKIRIFGSVAYAFTVFFSGIIAAYNYKLAFYIGASSFVLTSVIITWIKPLDFNLDQELVHKAEPKKLFKNKKYWCYAILVTLTLTTMFTFDTYVPIYLEDIYGVNAMYYGFIVSAYIFIELIILFILGRVGKRIPNIYLYLAMIISLVIRYGIYALSGVVEVPLWSIIMVTMLRSIPISVSIYMMMNMIVKLVEPYNVTIATIIMGSIRSIFSTVLVLFGGFLTNNPTNYKYWFLIGVGFSILALAFIDYKNSVKVE